MGRRRVLVAGVVTCGVILALGIALFMLNRPVTSAAGDACGTGLDWRSHRELIVASDASLSNGDQCADAVSTSHTQAGIVVGTVIALTLVIAVFATTTSRAVEPRPAH